MIKKKLRRNRFLFIRKSREAFHELLVFFIPKYQMFWKRKGLIIWFIVSDLIFCRNAYNIFMFICLSIIYAVFVTLVLILGEKILLILDDTREIATLEERKRLYPLQNELIETFKNSFDKEQYIKIKLKIIDTTEITVYTIGNTIVISRMAMQIFNDFQLKGVLAHEMAHIQNGDSQVSLLINYGTTMYLYIVYFIQYILKIIYIFFSGNIIGSLADFIRVILERLKNLILLFWNILFGIHSKRQEYKADKYTQQMGYGENLKEALKTLYDMQISDKKDVIKRMEHSHPRLAYRIRELEKLK